MEAIKDENSMQKANSPTSDALDYDPPYQKVALLTTGGIISLARLALAVTGNDASDITNELTGGPDSNLDETDIEKVFTQCIEIIEKVNDQMRSVIIEHEKMDDSLSNHSLN